VESVNPGAVDVFKLKVTPAERDESNPVNNAYPITDFFIITPVRLIKTLLVTHS
jgi:hypothetical protein